ncbi:MAG: DNA translocase FtsK [Anaerolineae bacterium]
MEKESGLRYTATRLADDLWHYRMEIVGLIVACWGLAALAAMLHLTGGILISWLSQALLLAFGVGAPAVALSLVLAGSVIAAKPLSLDWPRLAKRASGLLALWLACLVLAEVVSPSASGRDSFGGVLGWATASALRAVGGKVLPWLFAGLLIAEGLHLAMDLPWRQTIRWLQHAIFTSVHILVRSASALVAHLQETLRAKPMAVAISDEADDIIEEPTIGVVTTTAPVESVAPQAQAVQNDSVKLPPLSIFDPPVVADGSSGGDERIKAQIIKETLAGFGVPAEVVEIQRGPAVTRFGVQPGYLNQVSGGSLIKRKVRVNKIRALTDDLALALAAAPIRVEAPIPGRPLVGIEVPNSAVSLVGMWEILESPEYQQAKAALKICFGRDISGKPVIVALERLPHLLIAGATGSGKSVCISAIIASLLYAYTPKELRLLLIDPKRVELARYAGVPHLLGKPEVEVDGAIAALRWACKQMDDRYQSFARLGVRDIRGYNALASEGLAPLPRIVIIIDELADLMLTAPDEVERAVCRLAQMARATGIHLVVATQRPSVDVVTGLIKANFPARVSFAVMSQMDSRVILDSPGAESLIGHGDMLYMAPDSNKLMRLQGTWVSDDETRRLVNFWHEQVADRQALPVCPWSGMLEDEEEDELFQQAVEAAREVSAVSASFLQRKLRIGYPRAAHLLDLLANAGIVGPAQGGGKTRQVLISGRDSNQTDGENQEAEQSE